MAALVLPACGRVTTQRRATTTTSRGDSMAERPATRAELEWTATVMVLTVEMNDVVASEITPPLVLAVRPEDSPLPKASASDWDDLRAACDKLSSVMDGWEDVSEPPSSRFARVASKVRELRRVLDGFGTQCAAAATARDRELLRAESKTMARAAALAREIQEFMPEPAGR